VSYQGFATLQTGPEFQNLYQFAPYGPGTERREKGSSSPTSSNADEAGTESASNTPSSGQERRRAQNRSAQRAFRIRKIQRAKNLEEDLAVLISEHGNLLTSYMRQGDELNGLRTRIANLQNELAQLRMSQGRDLDFGGMVTPDQFDGWQFDAFAVSDPIGMLSFETEEQDQTGGAIQEPATWPAFGGSI
jgi:hypothetical protein